VLGLFPSWKFTLIFPSLFLECSSHILYWIWNFSLLPIISFSFRVAWCRKKKSHFQNRRKHILFWNSGSF
jgi:hypothetical protein